MRGVGKGIPGTVIVLTGPSSVGKTALARHLQRVVKHPTVFLSGDDMDLPDDSAAVEHLRTLPPDDIVRIASAFHAAFYDALAAFAKNGLNAIGEVLLKDAEHFAALERATCAVPRVVVHMRCDDDVRRARERMRGDRRIGIADVTKLQEWVPPNPDVVIDTTTVPTEAAAAMVLARLPRSGGNSPR